MNTSTSFVLSCSFFFVATFLLLFTAGSCNDASVGHVQRIFLQSATAFSHRTTAERCHELRKWIRFAFLLFLILLLLFSILKCLLSLREV